MSRIDDLIKQFCPDGVEYKAIGDIVDILDSQRRPVSKEKRIQGQYPYYGANGVQDYVNEYIFDGTFLLVGEDGSVINKDNTPVLNWATGKIWVNNHAHILQERPNGTKLRYVYFCLSCTNVFALVKGMPPKLNQQNLKSITIPVPPLPVQEEIVRILDNFSMLEAELEAELEARKKQYEHYRNQMLSFDEGGDDTPVETKSFGDVIKIQNGFAFKSTLFKPSGIPVLRITNIQQSCVQADDLIYADPNDYDVDFESFKVFPNDIVIALSGATTGKSGKNKTDITFLLNQRVAKFIPDETQIINGYLYHLVQSKEQEFLQLAGGGAQPNLSTEQVKKMQIYVPPIAEQERIVAILDKFDALVNDISVGLPAEIAARRKQYEYYRNKLLDFKKAE